MTISKVIIESKGEEFFHTVPIYVNKQNEAFDIIQHTHDFVEICYVSEGKGFHYFNDDIIPISKGDLFIIPIGASHVFRPYSADQRQPLIVYNCLFQLEPIIKFSEAYPIDDFLEQAVQYVLQPAPETCLHFREQGSELSSLFNKLYQEFYHRESGFPLMRFTLLLQLLVQLDRYRHAAQAAKAYPFPELDQAIRYIDEHFHTSLTLEQISALCGRSSRQFTRLFKEQTGQTFVEYVQNLRMNKSCELLRTTNKKINEIAYLVGYHDLKFFHSMFKKKIGLTPRQYRIKDKKEAPCSIL
ncbi:AraC family transcriptional regulator [Paenibacillus eucommiae]|uniref:AraC-like DNA-binding protein n=1 Tax=Paenibacillus eucommiae TaxID=1355755 RepID=A0ABS4IT07_9BACL|nr:AraC family transcriptional regulator [Paenibacillus eucommiae]MBP1990709.1 AraC-like DNA-binding protein [Paenibacillus eucommiae]